MTNSSFRDIQSVIEDNLFAEVDLALRRGCHIDRDEPDRYAFLSDAQLVLEEFYRRYGCELVHMSDGFFYLLPQTDSMGRRHLSAGEMLVGQTLALLYLDPTTVQAGGLTSQDVVVSRLAGLINQQDLIRTLNPRRRRYDERTAQRTVRNEILKALRGLSGLGFVDLLDEGQLRLRPSVFRFADAIRGLADPAEALAKLVAEGKAAMGDASDDEDEDFHGDQEPEEEAP
jgi:chromosome partition protein MukE